MIPFVRVLNDLMDHGKCKAPRGLEILELRNYMVEVNYPFASVKARNLPLNYIRKEFQWYVHGDRFDKRITNHAPMWETIMQPDGSIASNYGQYLFGDQNGFQWVVDLLRRDPDSRQAVIPLAHKDNLYDGNKDQICTLGLIFSITNDQLDMLVVMRSNDIHRGVTADWVCFSWFWEMVAVALGVEKGTYTHFAASMHIYSDYFDTMKDIVRRPNVYFVEYPKITDVDDILAETYQSDFGKWLTEVKL